MNFMPHGHCYFWDPTILWLHVGSDTLIAAAYFSIPASLIYFVSKVKNPPPFPWMVKLFAAFILWCGITHIMNIITTWTPWYLAQGLGKFITAVVSAGTAVMLFKIIPQALTLRSPAEQESLDRERKKNKLYLDLADIFFLGLDVQGRITMINPHGCRILGASQETLLGKNWFDEFAPPETAEADRRHHVEMIQNAAKEVAHYQRWVAVPDHARHLIEWNLKVIFGDEGKPEGILRSGRDISAATEAEGHFRMAVEASPNAMVMVDGKGKIILVNQQTERLFGYERDELLQKPIETLVPERFRANHPSDRKGFMAHPNTRPMGGGRDLYGLRKDGTEVPIEIGLTPFDSADGMKVMSSIVDISERKKSEMILKNQKEELQRSNRELEQFAYAASHDLKAPLRAIQNLSLWIEEDLADSVEGDTKENLLLMRSRVSRMNALLDDLLQYSRAGRHEESQPRLPLEVIFDEVHKTLAPGPDVTLRIDTGLPRLSLPAAPLKQIFLNLFSNSIKHHEGGPVNIEVSVVLKDQGVEIAVQDDGPGIPADKHELAFQMFQTLKPRDEVEGSGMGLALVRKIAETHGGKAWIAETQGRGCCIRIFWPILP